MKIGVNVEKRYLIILLLGIGLIVSVGYVLAVWNNPSVWHSASETKVSIGGIDYSLQEAVDSGLIGGKVGIYRGATIISYNGAGVGGYAGGDAKCNATFLGSRMATAADFANGRPNVQGWYSSFLAYLPDDPLYFSDDCGAWTSSASDLRGPFRIGSRASIDSCDSTKKILCSMP